jgi:uncharacterized protein YkwD
MQPRHFFLAVVLVLLAAGASTANAREPAGADAAIDLTHFRGEVAARAIFEESNRQRVTAGLPRLAPLAAAQTAAQWQAQFMAQAGAISHLNTTDRTHRTLEDRIRAAGITFRYVAENVAMNFAIDYEARRPMYRRRGPSGEVLFSYTGDGPPLRPHTYASLARAVVSQWMDSPGHRQNLLSREAKYLGCAAVPGVQDKSGGLGNIYCAQVFVTLR